LPNDSESTAETVAALLPGSFADIDHDQKGFIDRDEMTAAHEHAINQIPNFAIPEMDGSGAMEIFVSAAEGVCDFISAMDTARIPEWNTWYHLMNCGLPLKLSGETDFPCMSSRQVGQGRVYVKLGPCDRVDFAQWCAGLAAGRSYVSDGYVHAFDFHVVKDTVVQDAAARDAVTKTVVTAEPGGRDLKFESRGKLTFDPGSVWSLAGVLLTWR
jgi:hypothetical protein